MEKFWFIVKREFITKIRSKSFLFMTFGLPILIVATMALIFYLSHLNNNTERVIRVLDNSGGAFESTFVDEDNYKYKYYRDADLEQLKQEDQREKGYGVLSIGMGKEGKSFEFYSIDSPNPNFMSSLKRKIENRIFYINLNQEEIDVEKIEKAKEKIDIKFENYSGEKSSETSGSLKIVVGMLIGYLLMFFIMNYGSMVLRSVVEEKTSRIIEIIVSSIKPINFILGKIIGTSLVGVAQVGIWLVIGGVMLVVAQSMFGVGTEGIVPDTPQGDAMVEILSAVMALPLAKLSFAFFMYFIGGYLLYSSVYAAIGAAVDNETDSQQFLIPVIMVIMVAIYVGFTTIMDDPHGTVSVIFSYIPFTSPINMPMRIPFGVSWWEIIASVIILYVTFFAMIWLSAKIYRIGILMYGQKPSYREIYKWLKFKE